jgi:hypothetical protein
LIRRAVLALAIAAIAIAFFAVRPHGTTGPALRDFESYYAAGSAWGYGNDPYSRDVWRTERTIPGVIATRDELLPFVGPPFGLPFWHALSGLPWSGATIVWECVLSLSLATIALGSLRLGGGRIDAFDAVATFVVCAGFGPLTSGVALGQVAVVSCAAIVVTPFLLAPRLAFAAAAAALVAALQPNIAIVLAARLGGARTWIAFAFAATVALGGSLVALGGPAGFLHYVDVVRAHAAAERFIAIQTTPAAVARGFGASPTIAGAIAAGVALAAIALVFAQCASRRYAPNDRLALACAALPLIAPFAHEHDFTVAFFPALVSVRRARGPAWILGAVAMLGVGVDWLGLAQRPTGVAATVCLTLGAAFALAALARDRLRPYHFVPIVVALAAAVTGALVARHPLPTWPDGLGPHFHVAFDVPASVVWHLEQIASGIGALDPAWALLRLFSLASCALVWLVASVVLRGPVTERATRPNSAASSKPHPPRAVAYPSD